MRSASRALSCLLTCLCFRALLPLVHFNHPPLSLLPSPSPYAHVSRPPQPVDRRSARDADVGEGGFLLGGTGIAEVALPEAFRRANEAETTRAKQAFLERRNLRGAAAVALALGAGAETARALQGSGRGGASSAAAAAGASARASIAAAALAAATEGDAEEAAAVAAGLGAARVPEGHLTLPDGSSSAAAGAEGAGGGAEGGGAEFGADGMLSAPSRFIVGNLSSNFRLHGREYAMKMKGDSGAALHPMMQRSGYGTAAGSALAVTGEGVAGLIHQLKHGHSHSHAQQGHGGRGGGRGGGGAAHGRGGEGDGSRRAGPHAGRAGDAAPSGAAAGAGDAGGRPAHALQGQAAEEEEGREGRGATKGEGTGDARTRATMRCSTASGAARLRASATSRLPRGARFCYRRSAASAVRIVRGSVCLYAEGCRCGSHRMRKGSSSCAESVRTGIEPKRSAMSTIKVCNRSNACQPEASAKHMRDGERIRFRDRTNT